MENKFQKWSFPRKELLDIVAFQWATVYHNIEKLHGSCIAVKYFALRFYYYYY